MSRNETKSAMEIEKMIVRINDNILNGKGVKLTLNSRRDSRMWVTYQIYEYSENKEKASLVFEGRAGEVKGFISGIIQGARYQQS